MRELWEVLLRDRNLEELILNVDGELKVELDLRELYRFGIVVLRNGREVEVLDLVLGPGKWERKGGGERGEG